MTTMQIDRAVVEQALEALEAVYGDSCDAIHALRAALAQQDEPQGCATEEDCTKQPWCRIRGECQRKQAEPLNLSDRAVQRRLAAQWGYVPAAQAEPVEPVAVVATQSDVWRGYNGQWAPPGEPIKMVQMLRDLPTGTLLYTAPPQRKPLTEKEIVDAVREAEMESRKLERFAALVAAAEREACAALLEANGMRCGEESLSRLILETNAAAIRARNNT